MTSSAVSGRLAPESGILTPLPPVLHQGLTAVAVLACLSFFASSATVLYLTVKLVRWHLRSRRGAHDGSHSPNVDLSLGLAPQHFGESDGRNGQRGQGNRSSPNQFLVLLYNLLIADMHQAASFLINGVWVAKDTIQVGSPACFAQGWLVSNGDVAGGLFLSAIAIHTYLTVVWNRKPPQRVLYAGVVGVWIFTYFISALGIAITHNGKSGGGFYVRAGAWCWINLKYENLRLLTHYLFIFISLAVVSILYTLIFFTLRRRQNQAALELSQPRPDDQSPPKSSLDFRPKTTTQATSTPTPPNAHNGHHPAFLIYPLIYMVCTAPLALGRIATMAGATVPLGYFCAAGALITSNGWLDVLLWGLTRRALLFGSDVDAEDVGLGTFAFMRTPPGRKYGNMVWVQGASGTGEERQAAAGADEARDGSGWGRGDMAIQMDVVTTVEIEVDVDKAGTRHREYSMSVDSSEKDAQHH
ncbi:hypothetical protein CONLIGDRAFT_697950 [Coniochaeta ligniaria NRRL 30616]|uniref:Uncharacterized protein n=1 Tax=Coniochaeta ligniaria NRRL 30616 TaxID=1408157 RepID=A0A1J7IWY1_9PEZI|nr:hypothetical protein CONLIGDRAFT_697950 [Coniochaeta ligniaria NRRL 30616]